jgi:hypothetical protein
MFEKKEITGMEFSEVLGPAPVYESGNIVHEAAIVQMIGYKRSIDSKSVFCSADVSGRVSFSILTEDLRIELAYKIENAHFNRIKRILPLGKSPFVATFSENEQVKIWNAYEGYLSYILNQYKISLDVDFCLCDDNRFLGMVSSQGVVKLYGVEFNANSKNVYCPGLVVERKVAETVNPRTKFVIECSNRIEIPFLSVLMWEEGSVGLTMFILQLRTLETEKIRIGGGLHWLREPSLATLELMNFKTRKDLEVIDDWEEYYTGVKTLVYDQLTGALAKLGQVSNASIAEEERFSRVGCYDGRVIFVLDMSDNVYPHTAYFVDQKLQYLCIQGAGHAQETVLGEEAGLVDKLSLPPSGWMNDKQSSQKSSSSKPSLPKPSNSNGEPSEANPSSKKSGVSSKSKVSTPKVPTGSGEEEASVSRPGTMSSKSPSSKRLPSQKGSSSSAKKKLPVVKAK